jgi:hypothetical protein
MASVKGRFFYPLVSKPWDKLTSIVETRENKFGSNDYCCAFIMNSVTSGSRFNCICCGVSAPRAPVLSRNSAVSPVLGAGLQRPYNYFIALYYTFSRFPTSLSCCAQDAPFDDVPELQGRLYSESSYFIRY